MGTKEVNEKARDAGFDLLVVMGNKMAEGGSVTRTIAVEGEEEDGVGQEGMLCPSFLIDFPLFLLVTELLLRALRSLVCADYQKPSKQMLKSISPW